MTVGTTTHVSIGGHEYLVKPYSYSRRKAPEFGPRFTGGDPDFNNLAFWQHWAQRCFIGGADQDLFADDAMYDEGVGLNTTEHEKVTISRDLLPGAGSNWALGAGTTAYTNGGRYFVYNQKLYFISFSDPTVSSKLWEYQTGTDGWSQIGAFTGVVARSIAAFDGKLFIGGLNTAGTAAIIKYSNGALGTWTTLTNPSGVGTRTVYAMRAFQQRLYAAFGTSVWRLKDDLTWDGNTVFYKADLNSESNRLVAMEIHLGFLYMLSDNGHVHRTDGNSTFDIWQWDGQTQGLAIKSFDGRLFIITFEYSTTADVGYAALYQMSGSAVTQLKRWGDETAATKIGNMAVFDRHLLYGASNLLGFGQRAGFGVAIYDPIEDAHSIIAENSNTSTYARGLAPYTNYIVDDQIVFNGYLFAAVRGHGGFKTPYKGARDRTLNVRRYDITPAGGSATSTNGGWLTTSTYDAGTPGVTKMWRKIVIDATIKTNTAIIVDYSIDNGSTWTSLTAITTVQTRGKTEFWLNNVKSTSFKLRITLRTTSATVSPELWGFVVSYMPLPEPNWLWTMTLVISDKQVLMDGTTSTPNTETEIDFLGDLYRAKSLTTFIDIDGVQWATNGPGVLVYDFDYRPGIITTDPLEGEVTITLLEAVETY